jgi:hypothetical protein
MEKNMRQDTCLTWWPRDPSVAALFEFRERVTRCLQTAREKAGVNEFYRRMVPGLEADQTAVNLRISKAQKQRQEAA